MLHYHEVNVFEVQKYKRKNKNTIFKLLNIPTINNPNWSFEEVNKEIKFCTTILGYVVR